MLRTNEAGSLRADQTGQTVTLAGWVARRRDHGGVAFLDLRDASGVVQVVARDEVLAQGGAHDIRNEYCVQVTGEVRRRPEGNENADLPTGEVEVVASAIDVLNPSAPLPFQIDERVNVGEESRLKYRYLDLRRPAPGRGDPACVAGQRRRAGRPRRPRLRRDRDADHDALDARGGARLHRAGPAGAGVLVCVAAEPAAVQAAAHGGGDGAVLPDRPLLPGRGLPGRPAAGVHPARHRDELRRGGRRPRARRGDRRRSLEAHRRGRADADAAADLRRGDGAVRHRQARHPLRPRAGRVHGVLPGHRFPRLPAGLRRRRRHARRRVAVPQAARRLAGVGQAARRARGWPTCWSRRTARWVAAWPSSSTRPRPRAGGSRRRRSGRLHLLRGRSGQVVPGPARRRAPRDRAPLRAHRTRLVGVPLGQRRPAVRAGQRGGRRR